MPKLNKLTSGSLGTLHSVTPVCYKCVIDADASSGTAFAFEYPIDIVDVIARSTATVASATATVSDGTNDITDALDIDTVAVRDVPATIDSTYASGLSGVTITTASAADRAIVYIYGLRV